jgi:hypothetical protein
VIDAGTAISELEEYAARRRAELNQGPEIPAMQWRSFRTLPDPRG